MRGIINNIILYEMRAKALSVLIANTQRALEEFAPEEKPKEQTERLDNCVKGLTMNLRDMLTRFWVQKEHKERRNEPMTSDQVKSLEDFASFAKTLTEDVRSLLTRFQKANGQTFEEKLDKEIKEMEAHVKARLKEFDEALEESLSGKRNTWKGRLREYVGK